MDGALASGLRVAEEILHARSPRVGALYVPFVPTRLSAVFATSLDRICSRHVPDRTVKHRGGRP